MSFCSLLDGIDCKQLLLLTPGLVLCAVLFHHDRHQVLISHGAPQTAADSDAVLDGCWRGSLSDKPHLLGFPMFQLPSKTTAAEAQEVVQFWWGLQQGDVHQGVRHHLDVCNGGPAC